MALPYEDLDSVLRIAALAWARGGEERCSQFLDKCGRTLKKKLKSEHYAIEKETPGDRTGLVERYTWLRRSLEHRRQRTEIEAIFALSRKVWPTSKRRKSRATTRDSGVRKE